MIALISVNLSAQGKMGNITIADDKDINQQYIPITFNGKKLLKKTKQKASRYETKGYYRDVLLTDLIDAVDIYLDISGRISDSINTIQSGGFFVPDIADSNTIQDANYKDFTLDNFYKLNIMEDSIYEGDNGFNEINIGLSQDDTYAKLNFSETIGVLTSYDGVNSNSVAVTNYDVQMFGEQIGITAQSGGNTTMQSNLLTVTADSLVLSSGTDLVIGHSDNKIIIDSETNGVSRSGVRTLIGGTREQSYLGILATDVILISRISIGGTPGHLSYTINPGVSFTVNSDSGTDTSTFFYLVISTY